MPLLETFASALSGPSTHCMSALSDYRDTIGPERSANQIVARQSGYWPMR